MKPAFAIVLTIGYVAALALFWQGREDKEEIRC